MAFNGSVLVIATTLPLLQGGNFPSSNPSFIRYKLGVKPFSPRNRRFNEIVDHKLRSLQLTVAPPTGCPLSRELITREASM